MFVWLTFTQTLAEVIAGCEAAWAFFGGVFKVLIPDNLKPVVIDADPVNPTLHRRVAGLRAGPRLRHRPGEGPVAAGQTAGRAERAVRARRSSSPARTSPTWPTRSAASSGGAPRPRGCGCTAPPRSARPNSSPKPSSRCCCRRRSTVYDVPIFAKPKVAPRPALEIGKALYSMPGRADRAAAVDARADSQLVQVLPPRAADQDPPAQASAAAARPTRRPARRARRTTRCATSSR